MRGNALARPAVAGALDGMILTAWHGHRNDADLPTAVRQVWAEKFAPGHAKGAQSNVDVAILDTSGKTVRWFDSLEHVGGRLELRADRVERHWVRELGEARAALDLPAATLEAMKVRLPGLSQGESGVRIFAWLEDPGMPAYAAPIVEVAAMTEADWGVLEAPAKATRVGAAVCLPWLKQVYPPGVMERTDQRTKYPFTIARVEGELTHAPAGTKGDEAFSLLTGKVTLIDTGGDGFSFAGELTVVLTHRPGSSAPSSLRGVFEGTYPRTAGPRGRREFPMRAVFESLPAGATK